MKRIKYEPYPTDATLKIYGISRQQYEALDRQQGGRCAICRVKPGGCIDHDHRTGEVRGLLCSACNTGLGFLRDNPGALQRAVHYLEDAEQRREDRITSYILGWHATQIAPPAMIADGEW